jgi:hypothetical protein
VNDAPLKCPPDEEGGPKLSPFEQRDEDNTPRWVKVFGIVALIVIAIVVIVHVAGGGFHNHALP